ncbi:MAG TPA: prepilin peptidase [Planctomycetota bacterium]|nr:prepilin peptidase [Planctomycetota bacterium]
MAENQRLVFLVFSGLLGLNIGSFLNVCIFRLPRNCMSIVKPRSRCPKCLSWIAWYDNLPVVSWCALGGKCRHCQNPISIRYTLVELLTGALYLIAGWRALYGAPAPGWPQAVDFAIEAWLLGAMIVCTFIDLEFRILPDEVTISGLVIGLAASAAFPFLHGATGPGPMGIHVARAFRWYPGHGLPWEIGEPHVASLVASLFGALAGGGSIWMVGVLGKLVFRKDAMGFGDVKYMAMIGAVLGWRGVLLTFVIACLAGSLFGIGKFVAVRRMGYVPFGPFLSLGALAMLFWAPLVDAALQAYLRGTHQLLDPFFH